MEVFLKKHAPEAANHRIKVSFDRQGNKVTLNYEVQKRSASEWHTDPALTSDWAKNWGLWNKDVVEAFLQLRNTPNDLKAPYLEIQLSPLNQPFALIITEPRKTFFAPANLQFSSESSVEGKIWKAKLEVTLPADLKGTLLYGGFFSCLEIEPREYYALNPNPEEKPDFHRPELFLPLDSHE